MGDRRQGTLSTFASRSETTESTWVVRDVVFGLALELSLEVLEESGIEILTTQVGVTGSGFDGEDTTFNFVRILSISNTKSFCLYPDLP